MTVSTECAPSKALPHLLLSHCHLTAVQQIYNALHTSRKPTDVMRKRNVPYNATSSDEPTLSDWYVLLIGLLVD
jgi:hypothetical protein